MFVHRLAECIFETNKISKETGDKKRENQHYIQKDIKKNVVHASKDVLRTKDEFGS